MDFDQALTFVLAREGGYVNDPDDPGGATNQGIVQTTYSTWLARHGKRDNAVADITDQEVRDIYREDYWIPSRAGAMPHPVGLAYFDGYVNHRPRDVGKALQRAVNRMLDTNALAVDGIIGRKTLAAVKSLDPTRLAQEFIWQRVVLYRTIVNNRAQSLKFLPGWIRRLEHLWDAT